MIVWTHHPSVFPILAPDLVVNPILGKYWRVKGYPAALARLQKVIGTSQFLWCVTSRENWFKRMTESTDLVRWELDVPDSHIVALIRESVWEDLIYGRSEAWDSLMADQIGDNIGALVRVPLDPTWATCQQIESEYPRRR